jgi:predicted RNase H-like HicB family nuclease
MRYPIAVEVGDKRHAYGVVVPDLPGCFSAGDTLEEALTNAQEAILLHLEGLLADQQGHSKSVCSGSTPAQARLQGMDLGDRRCRSERAGRQGRAHQHHLAATHPPCRRRPCTP